MIASAIIKEETLKQRAVKLQLRILTTKHFPKQKISAKINSYAQSPVDQ